MMRASFCLILACLGTSAWGFMPHLPSSPVRSVPRVSTGARSLKAVVDPHHLTTFIPTVADFDPAWLTSALQGIADAAATAADGAAEVAKDAASTAANAPNYGGFLGAPTRLTATTIKTIHSLLEGFGLQNTYGAAIIGFTLFVKLITFPLNYKQIESTTHMQMIAPKLKEIQTKYKSDPQRQQELIAKLYEDNGVNPLAGCLPALVQIPIFISLYRALSNLAIENELNEPFLWLPNLEGPTYGASPGTGMNWLTQGWDGFTPSLGWHDTIAFLTIPLLLIVSQIVSQKIVSPPKSDDPSQQQSQAILKFLPFMVGYFSLNVPSGLGVYWVVNNIVTTISTIVVRRLVEASETGPKLSGITQATVSSVVDSFPQLANKKGGFGKVAPPTPPKVVEEEDTPAPKKKEEPSKKVTRPPPGLEMQTTIVRNPDGITVVREQAGKVVSSINIKLSDAEAEERLAAWQRGEPIDLTAGVETEAAEGGDAPPTSGGGDAGGKNPPPSGPPRRKKFKKRRG